MIHAAKNHCKPAKAYCMNDIDPITPTLGSDYHFDQLHSGIRIHGGEFCARADASYHQLVYPYIAFVIVLQGSVRFAIGRDTYHVCAGAQGVAMLVVVGQTQLFSRHVQGGEVVRKLTLSGLERWFDPQNPRLRQQNVRQWTLDPTIQQRASQLLTQHNPHALAQDARAIALLHECWQRYGVGLATAHSAAQPSENTPQRDKLHQALAATLAQGQAEVHAVAAHLHVSPRTLQRKVREHFDCSAQQWLQNARMQQALRALADEQLSIGETAYLCGYRHPSNFIQAFRRHFGVTPSALRRAKCSDAVVKL